MTELTINYAGIGVATLVGMLLGALWYSPALFGNQWLRSIGKTPETLGNPAGPMIGSIIASFLSACGVALLFALANIQSLELSLVLGLCLGLLVIFPAMLSDNLFCGWGIKLLLIQIGYRAISVLLMALVMYIV